MIPANRTRVLVLTLAAGVGGVAAVRAQQPPAPPPPPAQPSQVERPTSQPAAHPPAGQPQVIFVAPDATVRWGGPAGQTIRSSRSPFDSAFGHGSRPVEPFEPGEVAQRASCVLQVDAPTVREPGQAAGIDPNTVVGLLNSSAVINAAAGDILKLDPAEQRQSVALTAYATGPRFAHVEVWLKKGPNLAPDAADALMRAAVERLRSAVGESVDVQRRSHDLRRASLEKELADARARMSANQKKIREYRQTAAAIGVSGYSDPMGALANLRQQRQQNETELARLRARLKAVEPGAASPLTAELEEIVRLRQQQLAETRKRVEQKAASKQEVTEAELKVAEAKAQLAAQQRAAATSGESSRRSYSMQEASSLRAQVAEADERTKMVAEQVAKLEEGSFQALAEQYPDLQQEENRLRSQVSELTNRLETLRRTGQQDIDVRITILDGRPDDAPATEKP